MISTLDENLVITDVHVLAMSIFAFSRRLGLLTARDLFRMKPARDVSRKNRIHIYTKGTVPSSR